MVKMISNILRMLCVAAFLGIFLFNVATSINSQESRRKSQNFIKFESVAQRSAHSHQDYAPNVIYLGGENDKNTSVINLR